MEMPPVAGRGAVHGDGSGCCRWPDVAMRWPWWMPIFWAACGCRCDRDLGMGSSGLDRSGSWVRIYPNHFVAAVRSRWVRAGNVALMPSRCCLIGFVMGSPAADGGVGHAPLDGVRWMGLRRGCPPDLLRWMTQGEKMEHRISVLRRPI
ncbi:hypothetical protein ACLOJK_037079 [Asimina triloba]